MRSLAPSRFALILALVVALAGCDSSEPDTPPGAAGRYVATQFSAGATDVLALGGAVEITLSDDGRTVGRLVLPPSLADGDETEFSLAGTYRLNGDRVIFAQDADTFVRDATWTLSAGMLRGSFQNITVVLTTQ